jgi:hypothetical protein
VKAKIKAALAVLGRAFVVGAVGGVGTYLTDNGLPHDLHAAASGMLYAAAGGGLAAVFTIVEQWFDTSQKAFGRVAKAAP